MDVQSFSAQFVFGIDQYDEIETRSVDSAEQVGVVLFATRWKSLLGKHVPLPYRAGCGGCKCTFGMYRLLQR